MRIGIIGAGHAGVKAAETATDGGASVVLYSNEASLPYYRPRLIAVACGQNAPEDILMHPAAWYEERKIDLRLETPVQAIDPDSKAIVSADGREETFDGIIVAQGAAPFRPPFMQDMERVVPLWNMKHAQTIAANIRPDARILIVGGGILGIEAALRAASAGARVTVVELMERLMAAQFGVNAAAALEEDLGKRGIDIATGCGMASITPLDDGGLSAHLNNGTEVPADLIIVSVGARRELDIAQAAGLSIQRGILVDNTMRTSVEKIFACGDIVEIPGVSRCSALDANMQGNVAAHNLLCTLQQTGTHKEYTPSSGAVNFKYEDFEVHSVGPAVDESANEVILEVPSPGAYASLLKRDDVLIGAQMVGVGTDFRSYEKKVGQKI
ncbi:MAG: NAD(P)/FAD-dependent oxidoreductase [Spartobacteria bacterium]|nr:NAD(P)/FAD-dependent oxidoreductase [Spartobacteria bacterium]